MYSSILIDSSDYTAESIASVFIKKGVPSAQIILKQKDTSKRSYKKDVLAIVTHYNESNDEDFIILESSREGIYDTLPEALFHSFSGKENKKSKFGIIDEIKKHREEENHARNFFLPFEQEFFNIRRKLFSFEDEFELLSNASNLIDIYKDFYPILNNLTTQKGYIFLRISPLIHEIRDDFSTVEECLRMLLDVHVQISTSYKRKPITSYSPPQLGSATLGYDMLIGCFIEDGEPDIDILLTLNDSFEIEDSLFFDRTSLLTQQLCDYFIGAQYEVSVSYAFDGNSNVLSMDGRSFLGFACI